MRSVIAYVALGLAMLVMLGGLLAQIAVDAHHWMPRNWWPLRREKNMRAAGGSQKGGPPLP